MADRPERLLANTTPKVRVILVLLLLLAGAPMFFLGGPGYHGSRSLVALWDLGHILFFFLASWILCRFFRYRFLGVSALRVQVYVFVIVLFLGITVELLQMSFDGRSPSALDVLRNQLGCLLTLAFFDTEHKRFRRQLLFSFRFTVVILLLVAMCPLGRAVIDESIAFSQFPILSDFETPFEIYRWRKDDFLKVSERVARSGTHALKVNLTTDAYSGVSLFYFPGNWKGFGHLYLSIYFPEEGQLELLCRVHDSKHNNEYTDRFNKSFILETGWNDLVISLSDIQNAPINRELDMSRIENFGLFVTRQEKERIIYIDHVYLGR